MNIKDKSDSKSFPLMFGFAGIIIYLIFISKHLAFFSPVAEFKYYFSVYIFSDIFGSNIYYIATKYISTYIIFIIINHLVVFVIFLSIGRIINEIINLKSIRKIKLFNAMDLLIGLIFTIVGFLSYIERYKLFLKLRQLNLAWPLIRDELNKATPLCIFLYIGFPLLLLGNMLYLLNLEKLIPLFECPKVNEKEKIFTRKTPIYLIFLILSLVVYFHFQNIIIQLENKYDKTIEVKNISKKENISSLQVIKDSKIAQMINYETTDWNIYRNEEYGFELKYPNTWEKPRKIGSKLAIFSIEFIKEHSNNTGFLFNVYTQGSNEGSPLHGSPPIKPESKNYKDWDEFYRNVSIGENNYSAIEMYVPPEEKYYQEVFYYYVPYTKGLNFNYSITPMPGGWIGYDGKKEVLKRMPEFYKILATVRFF